MNKNKYVLFMAFVLLFSSCSNSNVIQTKIEYDTTTIEYSNTTSKKATSNLNYLLNGLFGNVLTTNELYDISSNIESILHKCNINEDKYVKYFDYILNNTNSIVANYKKEDNKAFSLLFEKSLKTFGLKNLSDSTYDIVCYYYDFLIANYEDNIKENPKLENSYLKLIEETKNDKNIFLSIDKDLFNNLFNGLVMSYLFFNNHLEKDNELTNEEILLFIKEIRININLNENQWKIIFKALKNLSFNLGLFFNNIILNDDCLKIGNSLNNLFNLIDNYIINMTSNEIDIIKTMDYEKIINSFIKSLDNDNKNKLIDMFNLKLDSSYLDCLDGYIDITKINNATYHNVNDLFTCDEGSYLDTLYGVLKEVFYDRT